MTGKLNTLTEVIRANSLKIIAILFAAAGFYLNATYVSINSHSKTQRELDTLKIEFIVFKQAYQLEKVTHELELTTLKRRFETKIKIVNQNTKDIDNNENEIIKLKK